MKKVIFAVLIAVSSILLGGCAGNPQRPQGQVIMVPVQPVQQVAPQQFNCGGRWQVGPCNSAPQGIQIPVGQIMQAGSGIGKCELVGGAGGAVGGALIGGKEHRGLGAILGAVVGAFAGNKYCESEQQQMQQVAVAQPQQQRVSEAYCLIARSKNGIKEEKKVVNPVRSQTFCDNLTASLRNGSRQWEDL